LAPGELAVLRVYRAGEWFRVYGRAREFAGPEETVGTTVGTGAIVCSFEVMDPLVYGDLERSVSIGTTPSAGATGLIFPVVFDVVWDTDGVPGQRSGIVDLEGTVPAPVVVELRGPMSNPRVVHSSGWEVGVTGPLAYDEAVIFDGRTRTVRATIGARTESGVADHARYPPGPTHRRPGALGVHLVRHRSHGVGAGRHHVARRARIDLGGHHGDFARDAGMGFR
jgi:hypothetical protein